MPFCQVPAFTYQVLVISRRCVWGGAFAGHFGKLKNRLEKLVTYASILSSSTLAVSHGRDWCAWCASTRRDAPRRWLWRLVRPFHGVIETGTRTRYEMAASPSLIVGKRHCATAMRTACWISRSAVLLATNVLLTFPFVSTSAPTKTSPPRPAFLASRGYTGFSVLSGFTSVKH